MRTALLDNPGLADRHRSFFAFVCFWVLTTIKLASMDFGAKASAGRALPSGVAPTPRGDNKDGLLHRRRRWRSPEDQGVVGEPWGPITAVGEGAVVSARVSRCQAHVCQFDRDEGWAPEPIAVEAPEVKAIQAPQWLERPDCRGADGALRPRTRRRWSRPKNLGRGARRAGQQRVARRDAMAFGPMRAVRYKAASGASVDIRVAGGAFVNVFKSVSAAVDPTATTSAGWTH